MSNKSILLCVDFDQATPHQHRVFCASMEQENWSKHERLPNVWTGSFENGTSEQSAISTAKAGVNSSALRARVTSLEVLIHVGETEPIEYNVRPDAVLQPRSQGARA
jgi:hypothetical protein